MAHPREFAEGLSIGIIMDGNGRWAKNRGLPRTAGHKKGAEPEGPRRNNSGKGRQRISRRYRLPESSGQI